MENKINYDSLREIALTKEEKSITEEYTINKDAKYTDFDMWTNVYVKKSVFFEKNPEKKLFDEYLWYTINKKIEEAFKNLGTPYSFCFCEPEKISAYNDYISGELCLHCIMLVHAENPYTKYIY